MRGSKLILVLVIGLLLAACDSSTTDSGGSFADVVSDSTEAVDERKVIEEAFVKQKDILKVGFLQGDETLDHTYVHYSPEEDELKYGETIDLTGDRDQLTVEAVRSNQEEPMKYEYDTIENTSEFNHPQLEAIHGKLNESDAVLAKGNGVTYSLTHHSDTIDQEIMELIGESLKTEADGALDLLYDQWNIDLEKLRLPSLDASKVSVEFVGMNLSKNNGSDLTIRYQTEDGDRFTYLIRDQLNENDDFESAEEKELDDGTVIDLISDQENEELAIYTWSDGNYFYELNHSTERSPSSEDDMFTIIESSLSDERSFASLDFLENSSTVAERELSAEEQQLQSLLAGNKAVAVANEEAEQEARQEESRQEQLEEDKKEVPERYPDHLRLGESYRWERSDGIGTTDVKTTVNSFKLLDEINGITPEEGKFLVVNITIEDLEGGSTFYTESFLRGLAYDSSSHTIRRYELDNPNDKLGDYEGKFPEEFSGTTTGNVVFDIEVSTYYRLDILDGNWLLFEDEKGSINE